MKTISTNEEFKIKIKKGVDLVASIVGDTIGPFGKNAIVDRGFGVPTITNDGVTIARAIEVEDDIERQGVELIKEVAIKTNEMAGDGTTTSIVLAHSILTEGQKYSENPMEIRRSLEKARNKVIDKLKEVSKPIKTNKQLLELAIVSTESQEMGEDIATTFNSIGWDGSITVEESKLPDTQIEIVEGYEVQRGYASAYMANETGKAEFSKPKVLVIGEKLSNVLEIMPILNKLIGKEFVIFAKDMDSQFINTLLINRQQGVFKCLGIKADSQNDEILQDIALVTGSKFISKANGFKLEDISLEDMGSAEKITANKDKTIILRGIGKTDAKIKELKASLLLTKNENDYDLIEKRIARLNNSVAVISVGAKTEAEMRDKYFKFEDGVNAVKSGIEEGIVEGGGITLYRISQELDDKDIGERILKQALHAPLKKIIENCGRDYTDIVKNLPEGKGYDAKTDEYVDMWKQGIIDPTKVERCCIENATSFAMTLLTSRCAIANKTEKDEED